MDWYGEDSVYVELQQGFLDGDTARNRELAALADDTGARVVATNDVHYHVPERYRLQNALVAASLNTTIDQALPPPAPQPPPVPEDPRPDGAPLQAPPPTLSPTPCA